MKTHDMNPIVTPRDGGYRFLGPWYGGCSTETDLMPRTITPGVPGSQVTVKLEVDFDLGPLPNTLVIKGLTQDDSETKRDQVKSPTVMYQPPFEYWQRQGFPSAQATYPRFELGTRVKTGGSGG